MAIPGVTILFLSLSRYASFEALMQPAYRDRDTILMTMGVGFAMILVAIGLVSLWSQNMAQNVFYLVFGFFLFVLGIAILVLPLSAFSRWDRLPVPRVRCRQCASLNYDSAMHCRKCSAKMF